MLELLMHMKQKKYTTSKDIREQLKNYNANTFYSRLDRLVKNGFVKKLNKEERKKVYTPGGDKIEYMLTKSGGKLKEQLIDDAKRILNIPHIEKKQI